VNAALGRPVLEALLFSTALSGRTYSLWDF
jgi:hypothetical protein